jgi:dolichyl-phosphate beta-glucosyltransferase
MKLSLVIPCYNEQSRGRLTYSFDARLKWLKESTSDLKDFEVIFVDDCSKDKSSEVIKTFIADNTLDNWVCIELPENKGKGNAILQGLKFAKGTYVGYMDADMSVSPQYIEYVYRKLDSCSKFKLGVCFVATRYGKKSKIMNRRTPIRQFGGKFASLALSLLFGLGLTDTQCGFKVFPLEVIKPYIRHILPSRWLIDIQILYILKINGIKFSEFGVVWNNLEKESTLKFGKAVKNSLVDLKKIWRLKKVFRFLKG